MKTIYILLLIVIPSICFSQDFTPREISKLHLLEVDLDKVDFNNQENYVNLSAILKKDRRWKLNKIIGITLASISAGVAVISITTTTINFDGSDFFGNSFTLVGVIMLNSISFGVAGISMPFFISSDRRKKERNVLLKQLSNH